MYVCIYIYIYIYIFPPAPRAARGMSLRFLLSRSTYILPDFYIAT